MGLLVALDENQTSTGSLYWDDGETLGDNQTYNLTDYNSFLSQIILDADTKSASYVTFNFNATYRVIFFDSFSIIFVLKMFSFD